MKIKMVPNLDLVSYKRFPYGLASKKIFERPTYYRDENVILSKFLFFYVSQAGMDIVWLGSLQHRLFSKAQLKESNSRIL